MWILPLLGYLGVIVGFSFLTLAIASGLYYLSELVEEHTVLARRLLTRLIYSIILIQVLLFVIDRFPFWLSVLSIASHIVYASNLRRFPIVKLSDPLFILSCILVGLNHWLWFRHFSKPLPARAANWRQPYQASVDDMPTFTEVASYFGLCVWLVPFALFVSLSAGENVLPSMGSEYATGDRAPSAAGFGAAGPASDGKLKNKGMAKALVDGVRDWVRENGELMGFWRGERSKRF
ncbi:DUF396 doamin protein [Aspergillus ambiguus]|uniref:uncharacterized protein n=1 Tax=Aspergillus ambiguus TaxID=176160 RepID=UPI003CCCB96B